MDARAHRRRIVSLAHPVYLSLLASVVTGIVNTVWVSRLGGAAVAAVAVATNTENVLLGVALVFASGTTVLVAHARGARDPAAVRAAVRGGVALWALVTPPVAVGGYLLREPLARLVLGDGGAAPRLATAYFALSLPGMAVFFAQQLVDGILKGTGDTRTPMRLALLAGGLILVCDPFLVHLYGVRGAAASTVLCRSVALAFGLAALRRGAPLRAAARERPAEPLAAALRRTLTTGLPMSADFTVRQGGALLLVAIVARLGVTAVAAYAIAYKVMYVATMAFYAVRQAASIHTAHTRGAGDRDARRDIGRQAVLVSGTLGLTAALLLAVTAPWIMAAFGAGPGVAHQGVLFLRCVGPYLLLMAGFIALGGVFEGSGGAPALLRVTLLGTAVQLPLAYALSGLGLPGVCLALALAMAVQCAAVAVPAARAGVRRTPGSGTKGCSGSAARAGGPG
ncbi:MATE family efflux transporter [Streptomyces sp. NPDC004542]|uniref:MATE family efflux transporter n=1 Tax=Streptomyces sp. NPDC004542 TaxID=3154281 RepID=UPI0033B6F534